MRCLPQIEYLVREGCIRVLGDLLNEANMVMMALEGLERILQVPPTSHTRLHGSITASARLMGCVVGACLLAVRWARRRRDG